MHDPRTEASLSDRIDRRTFLALTGAGGATLLAGCADEVEDVPDPGDPEEDDTLGDDAEDDAEDDATDDAEDDAAADDRDAVDEEPDYEGWFDDVPNYEQTFDYTGEDEVTVEVGAGDEGHEFEPPAILVDPGTTVVWEWIDDTEAHDVVAEDQSFESELTDELGHTFEHAFEEDGIHRYVCTPHEAQGMKGAVVVDENGVDDGADDEYEDDADDDDDFGEDDADGTGDDGDDGY